MTSPPHCSGDGTQLSDPHQQGNGHLTCFLGLWAPLLCRWIPALLSCSQEPFSGHLREPEALGVPGSSFARRVKCTGREARNPRPSGATRREPALQRAVPESGTLMTTLDAGTRGPQQESATSTPLSQVQAMDSCCRPAGLSSVTLPGPEPGVPPPCTRTPRAAGGR